PDGLAELDGHDPVGGGVDQPPAVPAVGTGGEGDLRPFSGLGGGDEAAGDPGREGPAEADVDRVVGEVDVRRRRWDDEGPEDEAERLAGLFRLLGDRSRVRILFALAEAGELCVCDLAAAVDVAETAVSQALRLLRTAGAVRARRDGRTVWYRLDDEHVRLLLDLSRTHLSHGS